MAYEQTGKKAHLKFAQDRFDALVKSDVDTYLRKVFRQGRRFGLVVIDPPSFSQDRGKGKSFDINDEHPHLIRSVLKVMKPGGTVFFSSNHQRFEPRMDDLPVKTIKEITPRTIPDDYRNKKIHRCWRMEAH